VEVTFRGRRGEVFLVDLGRSRGREIRKTRPWVIVSPDDMNARLGTYLIAPLTTGDHPYAFRVPCRFAGKDGFVVADQVRVVDDVRLFKRLGVLTSVSMGRVLAVLREIFS
jgi:mRNA interferase MazF